MIFQSFIRNPRVSILSRSAVLLLGCMFFAAPTRAEVLKIVINDTIHPMTLEYVERALAQAQQENAKAVLIEINTPGGLLDPMRQIMEKILASPVPVIIYVTPSGSRAASAGFFILQAADVGAMAPGTNTGAAHPVVPGVKLDDVMTKKIENDAAALMRSVVAKRGRNVEVAESTVRESKSFTEQEALSQHLIDYVASSEQDLFQQMRGKTIKRFDGKTFVLDLTGEAIRPFEMTLKQKIFGILMDPNLALGLLALGMFCIYVELNNPGTVLPGTVGVIAIVLAGFALNMLPVRFAALALIITAFVLFALEAKLASHGVLGMGGVVALTLGGLFLVDGPIPEMRVYLSTALAVSLPLGVITVFLMTIALRARAGKRVSGMEGMIGETGTAQTPLSPEGKVFVHGELWDASASSPVAQGGRVTVTRVDGLRLDVDPVSKGIGRFGPPVPAKCLSEPFSTRLAISKYKNIPLLLG
jgi:membrane-bound serine protease (ClpP class)